MAFGVTGFFCPVVPDAFLYYAIAIKSFFGILHKDRENGKRRKDSIRKYGIIKMFFSDTVGICRKKVHFAAFIIRRSAHISAEK